MIVSLLTMCRRLLIIVTIFWRNVGAGVGVLKSVSSWKVFRSLRRGSPAARGVLRIATEQRRDVVIGMEASGMTRRLRR